MVEAFDFSKEWEKISKEHSKRKDRIQAFKELWRARSELALAELTSGILRKEKDEIPCPKCYEGYKYTYVGNHKVKKECSDCKGTGKIKQIIGDVV